ncbi:MAG TPA: hypothetical protein VGP08_11520 [Pyrinomonadaceae bacterium]|jgi:hypothetical protein|nr:hypothetical protein [Pyrinomonadaceae bacterium]
MKDSKRNTLRAIRSALTAALVLTAATAAAAQAASTEYKGARRDPFDKYRPKLARKSEKKAPAPLPVPPIQARIDNYKAQKLAAMNLQQPAPKPTTALTLSEVEVIGIFRTPRGYAAMVQATPINLSYVVYPGEQFYNGMLVAIEETRLVFRRQTRWSDGRNDVAVESKPLRQPNAVTDSMTAQKSGTGAAPATMDAAPAAAQVNASSKPEVRELNALVEVLKALAAGAQQQQQQQQGSAEGQSNAKP